MSIPLLRSRSGAVESDFAGAPVRLCVWERCRRRAAFCGLAFAHTRRLERAAESHGNTKRRRQVLPGLTSACLNTLLDTKDAKD